jgi:hypothetical protein
VVVVVGTDVEPSVDVDVVVDVLDVVVGDAATPTRWIANPALTRMSAVNKSDARSHRVDPGVTTFIAWCRGEDSSRRRCPREKD